MFAIRFVSVLLLASSAFATPLLNRRQPSLSLYGRTDNNTSSNSTASDSNKNISDSNSNKNVSDSNSNKSLNNYAGLQSMSGFDDFRGSGNFDGSQNAQVIVIQEKQVVCHTERVEIIQQKLVILQEMAKKIITEQVCEVETQTIILEQFSSSFGSFQGDIGRSSGRQVGYDSNVANKISQITNDDGSLSTSDLGIKGSDVGNSTVVPSGNNWDDATGPDRVQKALGAAKGASNSTSNSTSTS
jgi:hypothetical protein